MHRNRLVPALATAALLAVVAPTASAQETANGNITALGQVVSAISVTGVQDLNFGFLLRGVDKTLLANSAQGGEFLVSGEPTAEVSLDLGILPGNMACNAVSTPSCNGQNIPLVSWAAAWSVNNGVTSTAFTPPATAAPNHPVLNASGELAVYVGATAQPGGSQAAGLYETTITLTAAYTGN